VLLGKLFILLVDHAETNIRSDLADAFPNGECAGFYRAEWLSLMIKDTRQNREFQTRTIDTARWAREQVKRQIGLNTQQT
jgi:importin subunit beta-1